MSGASSTTCITPPPPLALEAPQRIAALFAIESSVGGRPPEHRRAARDEHARPLLDELKAFLDAALSRIGGKTSLAQAIRYALSRWRALACYLDDGRLEMSNNAAGAPSCRGLFSDSKVDRCATRRLAGWVGRPPPHG